ncbi:MAG: methyltransferase domain-containing protein, partial [Promethearchaeota archaeon]
LNTDIIGKIPINMAKKLPFPTDSIDIIFSCHVIEHLYYKQFKAFMKESSRVLKDGGLHIIMTPSLTRLIDALYNNKELKPKLFYGHKFLHDLESISRVAEAVGYSNSRIITISEITDDIIKNYANMREERGERWRIETETYLLIK